jgi:methionine-rich copper-binding protein CopC
MSPYAERVLQSRASPPRPLQRQRRPLPRRPWRRRSLTLLAGAVLWLVLLAYPAAAHAVLVGSEPADGVTLARAPGTVRLYFNEDISPRFSSARLVDRSGRTVAGTRVITARGDPRLLVLELPVLETGAYGVLWQVLAEYDGHTTSGAVVFSVGGAPGEYRCHASPRLGERRPPGRPTWRAAGSA